MIVGGIDARDRRRAEAAMSAGDLNVTGVPGRAAGQGMARLTRR